MNIMIEEELKSFSDPKYKEFQAKLCPDIDEDSILGVRVPVVRDYAKKIKNTLEAKEFLSELPHKYYDENMLHGLLVSEIKDYDKCVYELDRFLPYVDNWAVCDIMSPKILAKNKDKLFDKILKWVKSEKTYTVRFAIEMLMSFYLDKDFKKEYNDIVCKIRSNEYYVNMMIAWYFATALAKQWDLTIDYIDNKLLDDWTHNKTIQKALESYRITLEQKEYLKSKKVKKKR